MRRLAGLILAVFLLLAATPGHAAHGVSIDGTLKYPPGFSYFDYTSLDAVKGGTLLLHDLGSFDKMNPFTLKGTPPAGLSELVFETLAEPSLDEPFAAYGLLAQDIEVAADRLSVTFTLNPAAKFSDNTPVTAEDVAFSLDTLKSDKAHPFYQSYYNDISKAEILAPNKVRFVFRQKNRELHMIASQLPIFSKKFYTEHGFDEPSMAPPLGSGPYTVTGSSPGKFITYTRNPNYWGRDLPVRRGQFNFDTITFKYYKDQIVAVEAFKAGEFEFMPINMAKQWARDLTGPKFDQGLIVKQTLAHRNDQGMQGLVFNTRRPLFSDRRVRQALTMAFDFEWANQALFFNEYTRAGSYFSNSFLAAKGVPKGRELALLEPFRKQVVAEVFTTPPTPFANPDPNALRQHLKQAQELLAAAGWTVQNGMLQNSKGEPFSFEIMLDSATFERVMAAYVKNLARLGVKASYRSIDPALYTRRQQRFDFDMMVYVFGQSQSPGNEQRDFWHSSAADREGSRNLIGIKNPVVDQLVDKLIYATTQDELSAACSALDRVLWYGYYLVPNWYLDHHRVVYWNVFGRPGPLPTFYSPMQALMTWWKK